jgi:hypothetical protein
MEKPTVIIQASPYHTASTLLVNAIYGLVPFFKRHRILCADELDALKYTRNNLLVVKTHDLNFNRLVEQTKKLNMSPIFICSERTGKNYLIPEEYRNWENVIIFDYNELNETPENPIENIVDNIIKKIDNFFPFVLDREGCITRIREMNARYNEIKDQPFEYIDPFYEIHGSHRNRTNNC